MEPNGYLSSNVSFNVSLIVGFRILILGGMLFALWSKKILVFLRNLPDETIFRILRVPFSMVKKYFPDFDFTLYSLVSEFLVLSMIFLCPDSFSGKRSLKSDSRIFNNPFRDNEGKQ